MEIPENGYCYHYKHDPSQGVMHHAYEILGLARHTEDESYLVRYRPLYPTNFLGEAGEYVRPLALWFNDVEWEGKTVPRFTRITDPAVIAELEAARNVMYGA